MNNTFTTTDGQILYYDQWYPKPCGSLSGISGHVVHGQTHWMLRHPLPPEPEPKTQKQIDCEAFEEHCKTRDLTEVNRRVIAVDFWHAGIAYERQPELRKDSEALQWIEDTSATVSRGADGRMYVNGHCGGLTGSLRGAIIVAMLKQAKP